MKTGEFQIDLDILKIGFTTIERKWVVVVGRVTL